MCLCRAIRTNNAAESSHAMLNASVRVSGAVSLDMFLFSIEGQLANTRREIEMGCPSHSKPIYKERDRLLAGELSDLFLGKQGILMFLDNCSDVMKIKNRGQMAHNRAKKSGQIVSLDERQWIEQTRLPVINAALNLFHSIQPTTRLSVQEILTTVEKWAFQPEMNQVDLSLIQHDSVLSLAEQNARNRFIEIRNGLAGQDFSISEVRPREVTGSEMTETPRERIFEGASYRLVMKVN